MMLRSGIVAGLMVGCGRADFDALDDGAPCGPFALPAASSLADDFSSGTLAPNWIDHTGCIVENVGEITAPLPANMSQFCLAYTVASYHLTCDAITMHVPETTTPTLRVQTVVYIAGATASTDLILEAGGFQLGGVDIGVYDPVADAWWRLREAAGTLSFDTSPDGTTWSARGGIADPMPLDHIGIIIGAGAYQPIASPGRARFRCYNVPPPCN